MNGKEWNIGSILDWTAGHFESHNIAEPRLDAEVLLSHVLECKRIELYLRYNETVPEKGISEYKSMIVERVKRKPVSYIIGEHEFMGFKLKVNENTLIPRPETELLVEAAADIAKKVSCRVIADIGTGSGNIALGMAKTADVQKIVATDISLKALQTANENIATHGLASKIIVKHGDLLDALIDEYEPKSVDMILSNPPYISGDEFEKLCPEVLCEPRLALYGGEDGLLFYEKIISGARQYLKSGGFLIMEIDYRRLHSIIGMLEKNSYAVEKVIKDYSSRERVIVAKLN